MSKHQDIEKKDAASASFSQKGCQRAVENLGGLSAQAFVRVELEDVNDNEPVFNPLTYVTSLSGQAQLGTEVINVLATDRDSGMYGTVTYELVLGDLSSFFTIDSTTGIIYLTSTLSHLESTTLLLMVCARDGGGLTSVTNAEVTIHILQTTLAPAEFERPKYTFSVYEDIPEDSPVGTVKAKESLNSSEPIFYRISSGNLDGTFSIHPWLGTIRTQKPLDHEAQPVVVLTVQAQLGSSPACSSTEVNITVIDVNDNPPVFPKASDEVTVSQSTLPGTALYRARAEDRDSGPNGLVRYAIARQSPSLFAVDAGLGVVYLNRSLPGAQAQACTLTLVARDLGVPSRASLLVLTVIIARQERSPSLTFEHLVYQAEVSESLSPMTPVLRIRARPLGSQGASPQLVYRLEPSTDSAAFGVHPFTGELISWVALDHEQRAHHQVAVLVSDHGSPPRSATTLVHVSVTDINDNRPYFPQCLAGKELYIKVIPLSKGRTVISQNIRHLVIPENLKPTKVMSLIKSPDHLQRQYGGKLHFSIAADDKDDHFEVDSSTGDLFLSKELDYEMMSHYLFRVVTKDHSRNPPVSSTVFLSVAVEDQNDHSPSFREEFIVISVAEDTPVGTLAHIFNAKDGDGSFLNSRIQYFIEANHPGMNPFLIHPSSGTLVTTSPLDRERVPTVVLTVTASDQAVNVTDRRLRSLMVKVVILDVNDHSPTFTSFPIAHVREDAAVGSLVHHITAQDPDAGRNGRVTFSILSGNENMAFMLDESSGFLTTASPLDYEIKSQHILTLLALDGGTPTLSSSQTLTITVLDVNDEAPVFKQHLYEASVKENQNPGEFVTRVEAMDRDSGINSKLQFEIMPGASFRLFQINSDTGEVVTATTLDREVQEVLTLRVILCTVGDENDHAPEIAVPRDNIEVLENQEPGLVYTFLASDMDAGSNGAVTYHIIGGNTDEYFAINEMSGELSTTRALDREEVSNFTLVILCSDLGSPPQSSTAQLQVRVLDVNDHSPSFPRQQYEASVREDAPVGTTVLVLSSADEDEGLNGQTKYSLVHEASGVFTIDPAAGALRTSRTLDREARSEHVLKAVARDCGVHGSRSTTVIIKVHVTDVNDNRPVWEQNPLDIFLSSQSPTNQTAAILRASDPDWGPNGTVTFSFAEPQSMLSINEYTGAIQIQQIPSSEYFPIWLQLKAVDQGVPARTTTGLLVIHMEGEDVRISFSQHLYKGIVPENCEAGECQVSHFWQNA
ncbi:hypothetical protein K5549_006902 [Capra hircus]|nr:hypothetical protein K5549_006902 [Capra hircus]